MKNLNITKIIIVLAIGLSISACNNQNKNSKELNTEPKTEMHNSNKDNHDHNGHSHNQESKSTDISIKDKINKNQATTPIIDAYIQIKNGLVADDKSASAKGAENLLKAFSNFNMQNLDNKTHKEYMEIYESAKEQAEHIIKSPIAHQREHFENLSTDIADLISLLGTDKTLYSDFCPMANNNKGAYWISEVKEIKNPYFGSKMPNCGSIKKQIN